MNIDDDLKCCIKEANEYREKMIANFKCDKMNIDTQKALLFLSINKDILFYRYKKESLPNLRKYIIVQLKYKYPTADIKEIYKYLNKCGAVPIYVYFIIEYIILISIVFILRYMHVGYSEIGLYFLIALVMIFVELFIFTILHGIFTVKFLRIKKVTE